MKPFFIAGPCVIESIDVLQEVAEELLRIRKKYQVQIIFKSSLIKLIGHLFIHFVALD